MYDGKRKHIHLRHGVVRQLMKGGLSHWSIKVWEEFSRPHTKGLTRRVVLEFSTNMRLKPLWVVLVWTWVDNCKIFIAQLLSGSSLTNLMKLVLVWTRCEIFIAQFLRSIAVDLMKQFTLL